VENRFDQNQLDDYQRRFSDWMSKQGLLFQLRNASLVENGSVIAQSGGLLVRLMVAVFGFLVVGYLILGFVISSDRYGDSIAEKIEQSLDLEELETKGYRSESGRILFKELKMTGGQGSFFYDADIKGLSAPYRVLGIFSTWQPEELKIAECDFQLKAGGDGSEMKSAFSTVLESLSGTGVRQVAVERFSCDWGYSKMTYGRIEATKFRAEVRDGIWEVEISGGTFQQNWIRGFDLVEGKLQISEQGVDLKSLVLRDGGGQLLLNGTVQGPIAKPRFDLNGRFKHLELERLIKIQEAHPKEFFTGTISGSLKILGSTNTGVKTEGIAKLEEGDQITVRERWPIFRAVSLLDVDRSYRRVDFTEGGFTFSTGGGSLKIEDLDLRSEKIPVLLGELETRLPSQEEAARSLGIKLTDGLSGSFTSDLTDSSSSKGLERARMSLSKATDGGGRVSQFDSQINALKGALDQSNTKLTSEARESILLMQEMNVYRFSGYLRLALPGVAFERYPKLMELYPTDQDGKRWLELPVEETFVNLSKGATNKLLEEARVKEARKELSFEELLNQ